MDSRQQTTTKIMAFLQEIGIEIRSGAVPADTFLPGILVDGDALVVDEAKLKYPGDLLHEAGHLAVAPAEQRKRLFNDVSKQAGDELAALAWSWAALKHLDLAPEIVFHANGYKGESAWLIDMFSSGGQMGVPLLQWMGLTAEPHKAAELGMAPFPAMSKWLRD